MADILIRGMEMPKSCEDCPLVEETENFYGDTMLRECNLIYKGYTKGGRLPDCPLVPLPEGHGRLVDAREVLEKADKAPWFDGDVSELGLLLGSEVTTIVPAEGGTDDVRRL